ncbi:hypothetical protein [Cohnella sp.]|uniref:hypothetical protein n=1 Tax=Cohnella sp. TaxID=1883426 RepID=UPI00356841F4
MAGEHSRSFRVIFKAEFDICLNRIESFFEEQGPEPLEWWYIKEIEIINHIEEMLSSNPFIGRTVERGSFKGLRRIIYEKKQTCAIKLPDLLCHS